MAGKTMGQTENRATGRPKTTIFGRPFGQVRLDVFREPFLYGIIETVFVK